MKRAVVVAVLIGCTASGSDVASPFDARATDGSVSDARNDGSAASDSAVTEAGGKYLAYVSTVWGGESREVKIGENDGRLVEIKAGLEAGERVFLDARSRAADDSSVGSRAAQDE